LTHRSIDLDDLNVLAASDSEDVLGAVERFADQCREAWNIGLMAEGLPSGDGVSSIVILGMGGSGVSGDVAQTVLEPRSPIPVRVIKGYGPLPEWIGRNSVVFAVSYSGSTEETLAAMGEAHERGARTIAVSSGGPLAETARSHGIAHIEIPSGLQPRASLGYLSLPILAALQTMGLVPALDADVDEAVAILSDLADRCHRKEPRDSNPAKRLAAVLEDKIAVIYGGSAVAGTAAMRFKCDLNEYGKVPAFWNVFPELNHNEIVGWTTMGSLTSESMVLVLLRDVDEHERVGLRFEITQRLIEGSFSDVHELRSSGESTLARLLSLVFVTQLASIYVGLAQGIDPGPVEVIQELKAELQQR
jgi:glucose/mannose-6-phosphate isomerase